MSGNIYLEYYLQVKLDGICYPQSLGAKAVSFKTVLDAPDKEAVTLYIVDKELNEISYKQPSDWFEYLEKKVKLDCPTQDEISQIGEAKASRDILVHNGGITNQVYLKKAGKFARFNDGQRLEIPEHYHRQTWQLIRKVIADVFTAASARLAKPSVG